MHLEQLTDDALETVNGGFSVQNWTCMVAGGLSGVAVGIIGSAAFGPGIGLAAGVIVGATVEEVCNSTYP